MGIGTLTLNKTYHLSPDVMGQLGTIAIKDLADVRKSKRKSAVAKLTRLLRVGGLVPVNSIITAFGTGADRNGEKILIIQIGFVRDTDAEGWDEFKRTRLSEII